MPGYYARKLAAESLRRCYEIAPPRVQQYFRAEIDFAVARLGSDDIVLDLGCGYGRTMIQLAEAAAFVVGVDTSRRSLLDARKFLDAKPNCLLARMDASHLDFVEGSFDAVVCLQNGLSAFHVDKGKVVREALRVTRPGGSAYFSTYSDRFWEHRLAWFEQQASAGLVGPLDRERTRDGVVACTDGFESTTVRPVEFRELVAHLDAGLEIVEVDESSVFYVLSKARER
ncbi:MAG: class I SAM-dependent methyltransferase [Acidimicrobiales bacterium]|jgi:2-polyprenyl-6-hydroxyphenyl methylase/3-demethylubiquinone-9 3-methyltransferase